MRAPDVGAFGVALGAILLISLELDEILSLSDRILVMYEGEIVGEHGAEVSEEAIGMEMLGAKREEVA